MICDPNTVAIHVKNMLKPEGTCMIVEVASNDKSEENIPSPLARIGYAGSIFVCIPTALVQRGVATAVVAVVAVNFSIIIGCC